MREMSEAEMYNFIIKDGKDLPSIRKNTRALREKLVEEQEKRVFALSQIDPQNKDRHEREASRIFEDKNRKLDVILMRIAEDSPARPPLYKIIMDDASARLTGSRRAANRIRTFFLSFTIGFVLIGAVFYGTYVFIPSYYNFSFATEFIFFFVVGIPFMYALMAVIYSKER